MRRRVRALLWVLPAVAAAVPSPSVASAAVPSRSVASAAVPAPAVASPAAGAQALAARAPAAPAPPALSARAAILVEASTGRRLFARGADAELPIASATKLMTALLVLEHARLNQVLAAPDYSLPAVYSQIGLRPGERMSVHDLLVALLLPSADDAAQDLAYNVGHGSVARFVAMMNARARSLGLTHTHYSTPSGIDTPGNHSSASDLVALAAYLRASHPFFAHVVALPRALLRTGDHPRAVANRNTLVGRVPWIDGVKTGHTLAAGYVLVGSGRRNGMTLFSAVLGTPSEAARDADTLALLRFGFASFRLVDAVRAGRLIARWPVRGGTPVPVIAGRTLRAPLTGAEAARIKTSYARHQLVAPLPRHAVVGEAVVTAGGRTLGRVPLLLARALAAPGSAAAWIAAAGGGGALVLVLALIAWRRRVLRRRRARRDAARAARAQRPRAAAEPAALESRAEVTAP